MKRKTPVDGDLLTLLAVKRQHDVSIIDASRNNQECRTQLATCDLQPPGTTMNLGESFIAIDYDESFQVGEAILDQPVEPFPALCTATFLSADDCAAQFSSNPFPRVTGDNEIGYGPRTGLVFEAADKHFDQRNRLHPERPDRITNLFDAICQDQALLSRCRIFLNEINSKQIVIDRRDFLRVHSSAYVQRLKRISQCSCINRLEMESNQYHSVYLTSDSLMEAEKASQSFCYLVSRVVLGDVNNGFAIIRPPGHHAQSGMAGGYCVINHVAVAASYALTNLGLSKILIVDWDVHHGNGTQEIFFDNPNVLYISLHRWEGGNFFPFSANAGPTHIGKGRGKGYNANVGWSRKGMGDAEYLAAWTRLVLPLAREFDPDLVLVSAGFDAAQGDMGDCNVAPQCFGQMTRMLMTLANGRVVCTLEGGYKRSILSKCVLSVLHALTGMPDEANKDEHNCPLGPNHEASVCGWWDEIDDSAARSIEATIGALRPYWKCLQSMSQPSG